MAEEIIMPCLYCAKPMIHSPATGYRCDVCDESLQFYTQVAQKHLERKQAEGWTAKDLVDSEGHFIKE